MREPGFWDRGIRNICFWGEFRGWKSSFLVLVVSLAVKQVLEAVCIYTHIHTCGHQCTHIHINMYVHSRHVYTHTHMEVDTYVHSTCTHIHIHIHNTHLHTFAGVKTHTHM